MQISDLQSPLQKYRQKILAFDNFCFLSLFFVLLLNHLVLYFIYNLRYIDTDQPYMWQGASDYAQGLFYEPRYYGQNYNTYMEALFAVPFIRAGMPVYKAVPLVTHLIFFTPFLFTSFYLFFKEKKVQATLVLCLLACMNPAYDLLNSLPRGFVTGLFFCSFFVLSLHAPKRAWLTLINFLFAVVAYFVNPNALVVIVPFAFYLWLNNYKSWSFYVVSLIALSSYIPLHRFFDEFYIQHPDYIKTGVQLEFSFRYLLENLTNLDARLGHITPFHERQSLKLLLLFLIVGLCFHYKKLKEGLRMFFVFLAFLLLCFCLGKTADGSTWVYFSYSRMWLAVPFFIVLCISILPSRSSQLIKTVTVLSIVMGLHKAITIKEGLKWHHHQHNYVALSLVRVDRALDAVSVYGSACKKYNESFFLIAHGFWMNTVLAYGGQAIDPEFPVTLETKWDKRYWIREKYLPSVIPHFMVLSSTFDIADKLKDYQGFEVEKFDDYGLMRIKNNTLVMEDFIKILRSHEYAY